MSESDERHELGSKIAASYVVTKCCLNTQCMVLLGNIAFRGKKDFPLKRLGILCDQNYHTLHCIAYEGYCK